MAQIGLTRLDLPEVSPKSHPTYFEPDPRRQGFASTWAADPPMAKERLARALRRIREALGEAPLASPPPSFPAD